VYKLVIKGDPVPFSYKLGLNGRHPVLINSKKYQQWKDECRFQVMDQKNRNGWAMIDKGVPVAISFVFVMPRGKTVKRQHHTVKPDVDNMLKPVKDAITGLLWYDDAQVVDYKDGGKRYQQPGEPTGVIVEIVEV
jgi:Holliday junction resolvase RusA-like endonuclease